MKCWLLGVLLLFGGGVFGETDDSIGDLFTDTPKDVVADIEAHPTDPAALTAPLTITGKLVGDLGLVSDLKTPSGFYDLETDFIFDARPSKIFRIHGTVTTSLAGTSLSAPVFSDLFFDYIIAETIIVRAGKQTVTWGQGRIFNPGDLVSDSNTGVSLKVFVPVLGQSLTGVVIGNPANYVNPSLPTWREMVYASQFSGDLGPFSWGLAGRIRPAISAKTPEPDRSGSAFLKTVVWGTDIFGEYILDDDGWHGLAGLYWEGGDPLWKIRAETTTTRWGLALQWKRGDISPLAKWEQSRTDGSGVVLTGAELYPFPMITMLVGVPWVYGKADSRYVLTNPDPYKRRIAAGLKMTINATF